MEDRDHTQERKKDDTSDGDDASVRKGTKPSDDTPRYTVAFLDRADMIYRADGLETDDTSDHDDGYIRKGLKPSDEKPLDTVSFSDRADMINGADDLEPDHTAGLDEDSLRKGPEPPADKPLDTVSFSDRADIIDGADDQKSDDATGLDDPSVRDDLMQTDETSRDSVSFSTGADIIKNAGDTGLTPKSGRPSSDGGRLQDRDETELPMVGGKPGSSVRNALPMDADGADEHAGHRSRHGGSTMVAEPDESLIDRHTSLDDAEIEAYEFGLSLESEGRARPKAVVHEPATESDAPDVTPKGSITVGVTGADPVELDADLNFPEVLIALIHEKRGTKGDEKPAQVIDRGEAVATGEDEPPAKPAPGMDDAPPVDPDDSDSREETPEPAPMTLYETLAARFILFRRRKYTFTLSTLALVVLLTMAVFAAFMFGTRGPYLKGRGDSAALAPESLVIQDSQTVSGIMNNVIEGPIFVIKGRLKNVSTEVVQNVRVTGRLFDRWDFFRKETVTCGAWISETELTQMDAAGIRKRLSAFGGTDKLAVSITPGQEIPFLIVFFHLPEDLNQLDRFTIDIETNRLTGPAGE